MGMDAIIKGMDLRFSQLLAEVAYELYPELGDAQGFIELDRGQISRIISTMAKRLDDFKIYENDGLSREFIPLRRVQYLILNTQKLYALLNWWQDNKEETLMFA